MKVVRSGRLWPDFDAKILSVADHLAYLSVWQVIEYVYGRIQSHN